MNVGQVHGFADRRGFAKAVEDDAGGAVLDNSELLDAADGAFGEDDFAGDVQIFIFGFGEAVLQEDDFRFAAEGGASLDEGEFEFVVVGQFGGFAGRLDEVQGPFGCIPIPGRSRRSRIWPGKLAG